VHDLLSPYQHRDSTIHRLPAGAKLAGAVAFVFSVVLLPRGTWGPLAAGFAILVAVAALSRVPASRLAGRLLWVEPFALGVALLAVFQPGGPGIFAFVLARATLCLFAMVLLSATTRFTDLLRVLWRIRLPVILVTTLALMHRYLFLLVEEMSRMLRARRSRTFLPGRAAAWRAGAAVAAGLFVRSTERAERIYGAMCARGWKT
jgi:cobalt/nickel transport system permease protein